MPTSTSTSSEHALALRHVTFSPPFADQRPGTSGLRKRVKVFLQPNYTEAFIASILHVLPTRSDATLVVGGDGRYLVPETVQIIIKMAAASGKVARLVIGANGLLSTPAASNLIIKRAAVGGILLTASHNPGGPENDFGIKFNSANGGPATESVTEAIFTHSKQLTAYDIAELATAPIPIHEVGKTLQLTPSFCVEIVDPVADYVTLMKSIFDFASLKDMIQSYPQFKFLFDAMHGVTGPYARRIFREELGLPESCLLNCVPSPTFNGGHPDPNLTYASELVARVAAEKIDLAAASDGDGDRNMILGANGAFVNPSDSIAMIASWAKDAIPYFASGLTGVARSMPTSRALDAVAKSLNVAHFEVPTGWKFFGNLMDAKKISMCGEESFGTGADHIREKDGIWAVLAWFSIVATATKKREREKAPHAAHPGSVVSLNDIMSAHYARFGRNYFARLDYEDVDSDCANKYMAGVSALVSKLAAKHEICSTPKLVVSQAGEFEYTDPIDGSVSRRQGTFVYFECGARLIFRLSGTGSQGATIRIYIEKYSKDAYTESASESLKTLVAFVQSWTKIAEITGRKRPTVIT